MGKHKNFRYASGLLLATLAIVVFLLPVLGDTPGRKKVKVSGKSVFDSHCAKCHLDGGNLVNPKKPVKGSKTLVTLATFKAYLSAPLGHMPYYDHVIKDQELLKSLYDYVKKLK